MLLLFTSGIGHNNSETGAAMEDFRAPDCFGPQWYELSDIVCQVIGHFCSNTDLLAAERVAKCWRGLGVPFPQRIRMQRLTKLQTDWLQRNNGRIRGFALELAESMQTSSAFEAVLQQSFMALGGPGTALQQLVIVQNSELFNTPRDWTMPAGLADLALLEGLSLHCCSMMAMSDTAFTGLTNLTSLQLQSQCLLFLPKLERLVRLRRLSITECPKLVDITPISDLPALEELELGPCMELASIPCVSKLSNTLQLLCLTFLPSVTNMPQSIEQLHKLRVMELDGVPLHLSGNPQLMTSLTRLVNSNAEGFLGVLEDAGLLCSLHSLEFRTLNTMDLPQHMERLTALTALALVDLQELHHVCGVSGIPKLQQLVLKDCPDLETLPEQLPQSLTCMSIIACPTLQLSDSNFVGLRHLKQLRFEGCTAKEFMIFESIRGCSALSQLVIQDCPSLIVLPRGLSNLAALQELSITNCLTLSRLPAGFGSGNSSLCRLSVSECNNLQALPDSLTAATALQELELSGLYNKFMYLPDLAAFKCLTSLTIRKCPKVTDWPDSLSELVMADQLQQLTLATSPFVNMEAPPGPVVERLRRFKSSVLYTTPKSPRRKEKWSKLPLPQLVMTPEELRHRFPPLPSPELSPIKTPRSNPFGDAKPVDASPEKYFASKNRMLGAGGNDSPTAAAVAGGTPAVIDRSADNHSQTGRGQHTAEQAGIGTVAGSSAAAAAAAAPAAQPQTPTRRTPFGHAKPTVVDSSLQVQTEHSRSAPATCVRASPGTSAVADLSGAALRTLREMCAAFAHSFCFVNISGGAGRAQSTAGSSSGNAGRCGAPPGTAVPSEQAAGIAGMLAAASCSADRGPSDIASNSDSNPWNTVGSKQTTTFNPDGW